MSTGKTLQELTIKDNFMFGAVMMEEDNCRRLLELILQFPIEKVEISKEKSIIYHPEYKGIRLDVYAKDKNNTRYNVEMQAARKSALGKRARYYHSQIDMELLLSGAEYGKLPNTYVIFICDFDPFGEGKYCYTFEHRCLESHTVELQDGSKSIFLNTRGRNAEEVPKEMVSFLNYVKADLAESMRDYEDEFVKNLQTTVQNVKKSREMEARFMIMKEMLSEEHAAGKAEGKAEGIVEGKAEAVIALLEELGDVPEELRFKIMNETELSVLTRWLKLSAKADSVEQFCKEM